MKDKIILATAYAINPFKGSEDGMGWNFVCQIARFNKVIAITRVNNKPSIDKYMKQYPKELHNNIRFLYYDLPYWTRFWKKGMYSAMLYYLLWQRGVVSFIKSHQLEFDIVHNLNFHNDWSPCFLWKLKKPFVWGPIGHHPLIPTQFLKLYKLKYWIKDRLIWIIKLIFWKFSFSLKRTIREADFIFCMNNSVRKRLNLKEKRHAILPSVATDDFGYEPHIRKDKFRLISVGRLVPLKGYDLSILAFASFLKNLPDDKKSKCELLIVGDGSALEIYKRICKEEGISNYVKFVKWMDRVKLLKLYKSSTAFLFPSHEGAGMVVSEALSFGLPVICLDNCGPGEFIDESCGFAIPMQDYNNTIRQLGDAITQLFSNQKLRNSMSKSARLKFKDCFQWDRRGEALNAVYATLV